MKENEIKKSLIENLNIVIDVVKKADLEYGSFEYNNPSEKITNIITSHFKTMKRKDKYGVYIIRQRDSSIILYIGRGGVINKQGHFKKQNIPNRLKNVRNKNIKSNDWFRELYQEKEALLIEYIILPSSIPPIFIESLLLMIFRLENSCLPYKNKEF